MLNVRTDFSFLRAYGTIEQIIDRAKELQMPWVGVADFMSTWAHIPFQYAAKKAGIKPIFGVAVPVVPVIDNDPRYDQVSLIAKSHDGLCQIYKLLQIARTQKYYRGRVTWKQLYELTEVVIIVDHVGLRNLEYVARDKVFFSLPPRAGLMLQLVKAGDYRPIATYGPLYPGPRDKAGFEILNKVSSQTRIGEIPLGHGHMYSDKEYWAAFEPFQLDADVFKEAVANRDAVANSCNVSIPPAVMIKPKSEYTVEDLARAGASALGIDLDVAGPYADRLERELEVVRDKKFEDYFLLVTDLVQWARDRMLVGPGRGSSGGSLLCYLLGITSVDPIVHGTLFERFIDPGRPDLPDIDIDFPDVQRDQVFKYLKDKYGAEKVGKIGTVSLFKNKSAINDAGKALGIPFDALRQLNATIPDDAELAVAFTRDDVKSIVQRYPAVQRALLIDGHARHSGVHAAGICVAADALTKYASVDDEGVISATLQDCEAIGLLKIDALGLRTLTVISDACEMAGIDADQLFRLHLDDPNVFEVFNKDHVAGVFQFEGMAVRMLMRKVKITCFEDLCALTSLARPGPLEGGAAEEWARRKSGEEEWEYVTEVLKPITEETHGTIVYQEQAMKIARDLCGFNEIEVNALRKAIGKKIPEKLHAMYEKFMAGATKIIDRKYAQAIWNEIENFGGYAFNKSHAVAYSIISYATAWLKAYHPREYIVACLRHSPDDTRSKGLIRELLEEGHDFVAFDPQKSEINWSIQGDKIYGGFTSVKGVGAITAAKFVEMRRANPDGWMDDITRVQKQRLLQPHNTPWSNVNRMGKIYERLYKEPTSYRSERLPHGIRGKVVRIGDIVEGKQRDVIIIGKLERKQLRDKNDPAGIAKRDGQKIAGQSVFLNLYFSDDTGEIGTTISVKKYNEIGLPVWNDKDAEGKDFLVKGDIINDDGKWIFISKMVELTGDERRTVGGSGADAGGEREAVADSPQDREA